ncbi:efflux RND transporter periplasmic adaptor subunit [Halopseudomonas bauzanensis]|uniref:Membrane fusion protein, multidrug efflux system n=1 Tax=Halopseudomonas bauzanensis TaxID=653930 RepID=A0A031M7H1_9GAMM|nr:efflux RND transporter periplasmic adaptor subunit [Halopseudomonas bauzanensis]EZQ15955.1 RND transporter [Halopseudomonas bauzanensis]SES32125.1 membrane fusion protein, multidrug efflux system [Halopseudomonas bauzanensis]SFM32166.1 RND family efflux transporter, MFP subunit [Halopseudomonas bauzanensis]
MHATPFNQAKVALLGGLLLLVLAGCDARGQAQDNATPPPPEVEVAEVNAEPVTIWGAFSGRVEAPQTVELRPRVSGYIDQVNFEEGELVSEGDVLFVIDPRPYKAHVQLAEAELARMRSQLTLASSEAARSEQLWERRAISREEFEQRNAAKTMAQAAVNSAAAALQSAQLDLEYTQIKAPVSGRIGRAEVTRGNLATIDATLLATLVSVDPLYVYFESDQQTAQDNPHGQAVPVRIGLSGQQDFPYRGQLDFVDNQYNARTGTLQYRAQVANPDGKLRPGQFARVEMPVANASAALLVDQKAVLTDQDRRYLYVLGDDNKVERRTVETGRRVGGLLVITAGLSEGERVVVNGLQKIAFPGMEVLPQQVAMRPDPAPMVVATAP